MNLIDVMALPRSFGPELRQHRLFCGDARAARAFECLMAGETAQMAFTDPPYNVPIDGHVCGLGRIKHREFAMASGEMTEGQFTEFLRQTLSNLAAGRSTSSAWTGAISMSF